jgi:hypothetical protein
MQPNIILVQETKEGTNRHIGGVMILVKPIHTYFHFKQLPMLNLRDDYTTEMVRVICYIVVNNKPLSFDTLYTYIPPISSGEDTRQQQIDAKTTLDQATQNTID